MLVRGRVDTTCYTRLRHYNPTVVVAVSSHVEGLQVGLYLR